MSKRSKTLAGSGLSLAEIAPLTKNQLEAFESDKNLILHGIAGTGKTFISCYLAFDDMVKGVYNNLVIIRSAVPTRDIGFLPGDIQSKLDPYMQPLFDNLSVIRHQFKHNDKRALRINAMLEEDKLLITPLTYIRGRSL